MLFKLHMRHSTHDSGRTWPRLAIVIVSAGAAIAGSPVPAMAEVDPKFLHATTNALPQPIPGLTPEAFELMKIQERLGILSEKIAEVPTRSIDSGLAGMSMEHQNKNLVVYWHGTVPESVRSIIAEAPHRLGVTATVRTAPYTKAQLLAESDRMSRLPLFADAGSGQRIMRIGPRTDGSGLNIGISGIPSGLSLAQMRQLVPAMRSDFPLFPESVGPIELVTRWTDNPFWWGGGFMIRDAGNACTNAFGVTGNNGASTYLLTAAHCGEGRFKTGKTNSITRTFGETIAAGRVADIDAELIRTPDGSGNAVYWGAPINPPANDPGSNGGYPVGGSVANTEHNALVCVSGAFSGSSCRAYVIEDEVTLVINPPKNGVSRITNLVWAGGYGAEEFGFVGNGDSGGPVVSVGSNGKLLARGIISAQDLGTNERPCHGWQLPDRRCSISFYYADVRNAMNRTSVHLNVG